MKRPHYISPQQCPLKSGDIVEIVGCADAYFYKTQSWIVESDPFIWQGSVCVKLKGMRNPYKAEFLKINYPYPVNQ